MKMVIDGKEIPLIDANSFKDKLLGLMFKKNINHSLRLKTRSIHTFFMREPIDIIMTDKDNKILFIHRNVQKNRIIIHRNVYYTYEFPKNTIRNLKIKDYLKIND